MTDKATKATIQTVSDSGHPCQLLPPDDHRRNTVIVCAFAPCRQRWVLTHRGWRPLRRHHLAAHWRYRWVLSTTGWKHHWLPSTANPSARNPQSAKEKRS